MHIHAGMWLWAINFRCLQVCVYAQNLAGVSARLRKWVRAGVCARRIYAQAGADEGFADSLI